MNSLLPISEISKINGVHNFEPSLSAAVLNEKTVVIQDSAKTTTAMQFPTVWLRDNCQCSECFHKHTKSRKINWKRLNDGLDVIPTTVTIQKEILNVEWQDKHRSVFDLDWLQERDFAPESQKKYLHEVYKPISQLWGKKDFQEILRTFEFNEIMNSDKALLAWLEALGVQGFSIVKNAPHDVTVAKQLADRIGFLKRTTYGEVFDIKSKENAGTYAYLMTPLPLHTDMPYYEYKAGVHILHCYVQSQSEGGANLITDGFYIAEQMRLKYPKYYEILLKTPVDWFNIGQDGGMEFYNIWRAPVICLDFDGNYQRINQSIFKRDSHFSVALQKVEPWYEAYDKFLELAYAQAEEFKTKSGEVFVFNNLRMLHGRTAYEDSPTNKRHLIGTYVDWDIIYSKMRILKTKKNVFN